jgi:hypothetical protein
MRRLFLIVILCLLGCSLLALAHPDVRELLLPKPEAEPEAEPSETLATTGDDPKNLLTTDPVAFFEKCLEKYDKEVKVGYILTMQKQERINGKLQETQIWKVAFREKPYSVYMQLVKGTPLAERILYVAGENKGRLLARPRLPLMRTFGDVVERDLNSTDAKQSGRYPISDFGLKAGQERVLKFWKAARDHKTLHTEYLGVFKVKEAGDRLCYKLRRTKYEKPEEDGITETTLYIDKANWFQVGAVLKGEGNKLIGEYFFRDIQLNPKFAPEQFERKALIP